MLDDQGMKYSKAMLDEQGMKYGSARDEVEEVRCLMSRLLWMSRG